MSDKKVIYVEDIWECFRRYDRADIDEYIMKMSPGTLKRWLGKKSFEIPMAKLEQKAEKYTCPHCLKIVEVW